MKNASGAVTPWRDQSPRQLSFAVGSDSSPQWSATGGPGNKHHVSFSTGTTRLTSPATTSTAQLTLFAVYRMNTAPSASATVIAQGNNSHFALRQSSGNLGFQVGSGTTGPVIPSQLGTWRVVSVVQNSTTSSLYTLPALTTSSTQGPISTSSAAITVGNSSGNSQGSIAELHLYGSALTADKRTSIEAALRAKWGLPTPWTLGGSVSGLSGTVALSNADNTIKVSQNGTFTFSGPVASGSTYAVTVSNKPAGQTCAVSNGSGTIASANVTNVTVTCTNSPRSVGGHDDPVPALLHRAVTRSRRPAVVEGPAAGVVRVRAHQFLGLPTPARLGPGVGPLRRTPAWASPRRCSSLLFSESPQRQTRFTHD